MLHSHHGEAINQTTQFPPALASILEIFLIGKTGIALARHSIYVKVRMPMMLDPVSVINYQDNRCFR